MLNRYICSVVVFFLSIIGLDAIGQPDTAQQDTAQQATALTADTFANVLKNEARGLSQTSIDEILEIRKRLGGGTGLGVTDLVDTSLKNLRSEMFSGSKSSLDHQKPAPELAKTASERLFFEMLQNVHQPEIGLVNMDEATNSNHQPNRQRIAGIRATARRVDALAADLEELELFGDADALRTMASKIRKKARPGSNTAGSPRKLR